MLGFYPFRALAALVCLLILVSGCEAPETEAFNIPLQHGKIESNEPLTAPLSGKNACAFRLKWSAEGTAFSYTSSRSYKGRTPVLYAQNASLTMGGKEYKLIGKGGNAGRALQTRWWIWDPSLNGQLHLTDVPEGLWNLDPVLDDCLKNLCESQEFTRIIISEQIIPCGNGISLQGEIKEEGIEVYCHKCN
ncbi:MAG: hypothetical protein AAFR66_11125 [Bacteroidota bacterium]